MMRHSLPWTILLIFCLVTLTSAMDSDIHPSPPPVAGDMAVTSWSLPPDGAVAVGKLYAEDLETIVYAYQFLLTGNESQKQRLYDLQNVSDRLAPEYIDILEKAAGESPGATSDLPLIYESWRAMNRSMPVVMTSFRDNSSSYNEDLAVFETEVINMTDGYDTYIGRYVDIHGGDDDTLRLFMYTDLLGAINARHAYGLTQNDLQKMIFIRKMIDFDQKSGLFSMKHPDSSLDTLKEMKTSFDTAVAAEFEILDSGRDLTEEERNTLSTAMGTILESYNSFVGGL